MTFQAMRAPRGAGAVAILLWVALWAAGVLLAGCEPGRHEQGEAERLVHAIRSEPAYRRLTLANGMEVILVSDPELDRAGAGLAVAAGSLEDPEERPGMAHFVEHMLFLGTEKYPEPGAYQQFVNEHAGGTNAYTADEHTAYFFEVSHEAFPEALDRFARFFVAPLFNEEYLRREMNAVASEHSKNLESDTWRVRQVQRAVYREGHPAGHFSTGSAETLQGVTRQEVVRWWRRHYSANLMTLAVAGDRSLDELERLARQRFAPVENRELPRPDYPEDYLPRREALRLLTVEPVADQRSLVLEFPLPPTRPYYRAKPLELIAFLLGHEGEGSLLSLLKARNLATSLSAGSAESTGDYASLSLRIGLTPEGRERYREVLELVFGAIRVYRGAGVPAYVFEENRVMAELDFRYRSDRGAMHQAARLSAMMQRYPVEEVPQAAYRYADFRPELYRRFLAALRPDNALVTLVAKGVRTGRVEPHYQAPYAYRELTGEPYRRLVEAGPAAVHLPRPNPFIPRTAQPTRPEGPLELTYASLLRLEQAGLPDGAMAPLRALEGTAFTGLEALAGRMERELTREQRRRWLPTVVQHALPMPVRVMRGERGTVWYRSDWRFGQPKSKIILHFKTGRTYGSPRQAVLGQLYVAALEEALNQFGYPVRLAGLDYGFSAERTGIRLTLSGYSPRMLDLLEELAARMRRVPLSPERFAAVKERLARSFDNQRFAQPYRQAGYFQQLLLSEPAFRREAMERALAGLTLAEVQAYARQLYDRTYIEGVVAGSLHRADAAAALERLYARLGARPLPAAQRPEVEVRQLPRAADYVFTEKLEVSNSLAQLVYQAGRSEPTRRGALLIIGRALEDSFYFNMRTRQQLGYIVFGGMGQMKRTLSLNFLIQSGAYPADTLLRRVQDYIPQFVREFRGMPPQQFEQLRRAVIDAKLQRPSTIGEVAQRIFYQAFEKEAPFDHISRDIRAVERLSREQVNALAERVLLGEERRRLAVRLVGSGHSVEPPRGTPVQEPADLAARAAGE